MEYLHPSVSSKIIDNSTTFVSAQGITQLFAALTSDLGEDNVIKMITSPSEFLFHYGAPNYRKHGQTAYNVMNWLTAQGGAYVLRVMPSNAGYSHAVVNIQTKASTKKVLDVNGNLVSFPDVSVRTTVAHSPVSNVSVDALTADLDKAGREKSVDGYDNHWLFAFIPKGRGKAYDNLGFELALTDSFDQTYGFRVYQFSVIKVNDNGSVQTIDGPFNVSFDPDAVSSSQESMFIKYVVEKYSVYGSILFNEAAYEALGEAINPNVNPNVLDFFAGSTRKVSGKAETYYDSTLGKNADVHIAVQKYDASGVATGATNYVDATSTINSSIVGVDNSYRLGQYSTRLATVDNMKSVLSAVRGSTYATLVGNVAVITSDATGNKVLSGGQLYTDNTTLATDYVTFQTARTNNGSSSNNTTLTALETAASKVISDVNEVVADAFIGLDYARAIANTPDTLNTLVSIFGVQSEVNVFNITSMAGAGKKADLTSVSSALGVAKTGSNDDITAAVANVLSTAADAIAFAKSVQLSTPTEADTAITDADTAYSAAVTAYNTAIDPNQLANQVSTNVNNAATAADALVTAAQLAVRTAVLEVQIQTVLDSKTAIDTVVSQLVTALDAAETTVTGGTASVLAQSIADNITAAQADVATSAMLTYSLVLQDFNSYVRFSGGSDGDIDINATGRATAIKNLLIQAYTGLIDTSLTNKKETPIDLVLDANYDADVKNAIYTLVTQIRDDFMGLLDTGFQANPQQAIDFRTNKIGFSTNRIGIFAQDFIVYDSYTGQDIQVTSPYYLSSLIPEVDVQYGMHWPFVGPRRGVISGFKKMSFNPTEPWKEQLYKNQINYVESDPRRTKFGSQLTSQMSVSALSNINNVRALLRIKRDVENLMEDYEFEFNDSLTLNSANFNLNAYLQKWISNRACTSIKGTVYASSYDVQQKVARVKVEIVFNSVIERIMIDMVVNG